MGKARIEQVFQAKLANNQKLFVPYIMAGDGGLDKLEEQISFLSNCGVSAIELGVPFSDPVADGPTIQEAGIRSLSHGTTLRGILQELQSFRKKHETPIILMTYMNPIFTYGIEAFARDCVKSGVDGVIIPDLPLEEENLVSKSLSEHELAFIRLVAMTSPKERMVEIATRSEGFLYAVSVMGTTGTRDTHDENVESYLTTLKQNSPVPVLAGFGVSNSEQAKKLGASCDGVIVGSRIVDLLHKNEKDEIARLIQESIKMSVYN